VDQGWSILLMNAGDGRQKTEDGLFEGLAQGCANAQREQIENHAFRFVTADCGRMPNSAVDSTRRDMQVDHGRSILLINDLDSPAKCVQSLGTWTCQRERQRVQERSRPTRLRRDMQVDQGWSILLINDTPLAKKPANTGFFAKEGGAGR